MRINRKSFLQLAAAGAAGATVPARLNIMDDPRLPAADTNSKKLQGAAIKGTTDAIARFIATTTLDSMPPAAVAQGKRCLVDGFGVILAGSTVHGSAIVRDYVKSINA